MKHFLLALFAALLLPVSVNAATLTFGAPASVTTGGSFNVSVLVSTASGESANAISSTITYPSNLLTLVAISKTPSIITLWPSEPTQGAGTAHFEGVILNPGWSGSGGRVITLSFQAKAPGVATLAFSDASVLANDGNATPILTSSPPTSITVGAADAVTPATTISITSPTHPNQNATYKENDVILNWTLDPGASTIRIGYDKDPQGKPTVGYDTSVTHKEIILKDGIWYFHVQDKVDGVWSSIATYRIKINSAAATTVQEQPVEPVIATSTVSTVDTNTDTPAAQEPSPLEKTSGFAAAYTYVANHAGWALLLLLLAAASAFVVARYELGYASLFGAKHSRKRIAHAQLHEQFDELREALMQEIFALQHTKTKRDLTLEEERFLSRFEKLLNRAERTIEKEVSNASEE